MNEVTGFIFALATFAAGFAVRPFGALVFGRLGDLVGRKHTFLITVSISERPVTVIGAKLGKTRAARNSHEVVKFASRSRRYICFTELAASRSLTLYAE